MADGTVLRIFPASISLLSIVPGLKIRGWMLSRRPRLRSIEALQNFPFSSVTTAHI